MPDCPAFGQSGTGIWTKMPKQKPVRYRNKGTGTGLRCRMPKCRCRRHQPRFHYPAMGLPMDEWTIKTPNCTVAPLSSLWPPPLPKLNVQYIQTLWDCGGGGELCCRPYSAGILHSVSDQIQNLPNSFTTPNKMTSEDDIKGLVSLKFLRPWVYLTEIQCKNQRRPLFASHGWWLTWSGCRRGRGSSGWPDRETSVRSPAPADSRPGCCNK